MQVLADPTSFDVAVTTYEMVTSAHFGAALSHTITWRVLVLDEGHKIKNEDTRVAHAMRHVACAFLASAVTNFGKPGPGSVPIRMPFCWLNRDSRAAKPFPPGDRRTGTSDSSSPRPQCQQ